MKIKIAIVVFLLGALARADELNCQIRNIQITLNSNSSINCQGLNIEGLYKIKLCSNGKGLLANKDGSTKYLFKNNEVWTARQDLIDFTNNISETEIVQINNEISFFSLSKIKSKKDGTILQKLDCKGSI